MKLTRKKLKSLIRKTIIKETRIKPNIPGLSTDDYGKAQALARHSDPAVRQQADHLAGAMGYEGSFSGDMEEYDNPVARELVGVGTPQGNIEKEVVIPRYMVDAVVDAHQLVINYPGESDAEYEFKEAARVILSHIDKEVRPGYVYVYGIKTRGYRAKEYEDAMFAVGDYL